MPQARFYHTAHFDEEYTGKTFMYLIEKIVFLLFNMYTLSILSNILIYLRCLVEKKSRKHPYFSDHYSGMSFKENIGDLKCGNVEELVTAYLLEGKAEDYLHDQKKIVLQRIQIASVAQQYETSYIKNFYRTKVESSVLGRKYQSFH